MNISYRYFVLILLITICGCKKDFLDAKPSTALVTPSTLADYQALLENVDIVNRATPGLLQLASDDYIFMSTTSWQSTNYNAERNSYIWAKDLFEGQKNIKDWDVGYSGIFICNNVLEGLDKIEVTATNQKDWNNIKGWALFMRAYLLYDLVRSFSPAYDSQTSLNDLGMPIRLKAGVDEIQPRSSVEKTYNQILADLANANSLLLTDIAVNNRERPSRIAVFALYARIYLSMRNYDKAEQYADNTLNLYNTLIDYNTIDLSQRVQFTMNNIETILNTTVVSNYYASISVGGIVDVVSVNPSLYSLYDNNDLRKNVFFGINAQSGSVYMKPGYAGAYTDPFTGLATDEIYLIKAECLARRNEVTNSLSVLNTLLAKRYKTGTFIPLTAINATDALNKILIERRKELVWRSLRWTDLKRLNKEGANITLTRVLDGQVFNLPPNSPRYIFPIPDDEIALSGIQQNMR